MFEPRSEVQELLKAAEVEILQKFSCILKLNFAAVVDIYGIFFWATKLQRRT